MSMRYRHLFQSMRPLSGCCHHKGEVEGFPMPETVRFLTDLCRFLLITSIVTIAYVDFFDQEVKRNNGDWKEVL